MALVLLTSLLAQGFTYVHLMFQHSLVLNVILQLILGGDGGTDFTLPFWEIHSVLSRGGGGDNLEGEDVVSRGYLVRLPVCTHSSHLESGCGHGKALTRVTMAHSAVS